MLLQSVSTQLLILINKTVNNIQNQEFEEAKGKKKVNQNWTEKMKEKFSNFMYKVNHSTDYLSQYNKLDFKTCDKNLIRFIWGNKFNKNNCKEELNEIFRNIILFTYRKDFSSPLESVNKKTGKPKKLNSDFGWGWMIRWGQMMLANSILIHLKRVIFNTNNGLICSGDMERSHVTKDLENEVISKFLDSKSGKDAPFSIKEITDQGLELFHKVAGDWYGTNSISQVIKLLNQKHKPYDDFEICVFNDGILFKSEVIKRFQSNWNDLIFWLWIKTKDEESLLARTSREFLLNFLRIYTQFIKALNSSLLKISIRILHTSSN